MRRRLAVLALLALLVLGCLAPAADARIAPPSPRVRQLREMALELAGREGRTSREPVALSSKLELEADGYRLAVEGFGADVAVEVSRGGRHGEALSAYLVHGTVRRYRLRARIGDLGTIAMRFRPGGGNSITHPKDCRGRRRFLVRRGVFVGRLRFRGEGGYVNVAVHRAKGTVREVAPSCLRRPARARLASSPVPHTGRVDQRPEQAYLRAEWHDGVSSASLVALKTRAGKTELLTNQEAIRGAMAIIRIASADAGPAALRADDALTRARLTGSAPFRGTGRFAAAADGTRTWGGGFSVDFPGLEDFALAGPPYEAEIGRTADPLFLLFLLYS